jgi:predicted DNA-binding WGR domain protein
MLNGADKEYCVYITIDELSRFNVFRAWGKIGAATHSKCEGFQDGPFYAERAASKLVALKKKRGYYAAHDDLYCVPGHPDAQEYVEIAHLYSIAGVYPVLHGKIEKTNQATNLAKENKRPRKSFEDWLRTQAAMKPLPEIITAI